MVGGGLCFAEFGAQSETDSAIFNSMDIDIYPTEGKEKSQSRIGQEVFISQYWMEDSSLPPIFCG